MSKNIDRLGKGPLVVVGLLIVVLSLNAGGKVSKQREELARITEQGVTVTAQKGKIIEHKDNKQSVRYLFTYDDDKYLLETEPTHKGKGQTPEEREFKIILGEPNSYYDLTVPPNPSSLWADICFIGGIGLLGYLGFDAFKNRRKRKENFAEPAYEIREYTEPQETVQEEDFDINVNSPFSSGYSTANFGNIDTQTVSRMRSGERNRQQDNAFGNTPVSARNRMANRPQYNYSNNQQQGNPTNNLRREQRVSRDTTEHNRVNNELFGNRDNTQRKDLRRSRKDE